MSHEHFASGRSIRVAAVVAVTLLAGVWAFPQTAFLVKDINSLTATPADRFQSYAYFGWTGTVVVFNGQSERAGVELWVSDGTPAGTTVLMDINRGVGDSSPRSFTRLGNVVYFTADDGIHGAELWKTDGTPSGTEIVEDIYPGDSSSGPRDLTAAGGRLFFTADDGSNGRELWVSDGSAATTFMVADIRVGIDGSSPLYIKPTSFGVFFRADDGVNGTEPWLSDGTPGNATLVKDVNPGLSNSSPGNFMEFAGFVFFAASDGINGTELWRTDGTSVNTVMIDDIRSGTFGSSPGGLIVYDGWLYFSASDGTTGRELWKTNGLPGGATPVMDIRPGASSSYPKYPTIVGSTLFFTANDGINGEELWGLDAGPTAVPALIKDIRSGSLSSSIADLAMTDFGLVFSAYDGTSGSEPWKSDGTPGGTVRIDDINPGSASSEISNHGFLSTGGTVFFRATDGVNSDQLWITDGFASGTTALTPLALTTSSGASFFGTCGDGSLFLSADDGVVGIEPWISDGTTAGTDLLVDLNPSSGSYPYPREPIGSLLPFVAITPTYSQEVWTTDCTAAGTALLKDVNPTGSFYPYSWISVGSRWFFDGIDSTVGRELWVSDGTTAGTVLVQDINPGAGSSSPHIGSFGSGVLFRADDGNVGRELWTSDGTSSGTSLVMDIYPGPTGSSPSFITDIGGFAVFWAEDGVAGKELWGSDGTVANTILVRDINPGSGASFENYLYHFKTMGGVAYFAANDGSNGAELWRTDGTFGGTMMVKDINPGEESSEPQSFAVVGGKLFFLADDGVAGEELWVTDGTTAGTVMVRDLWPGPDSSDSRTLTVVDDLLVIVSRSPDFGEEMWISDGTTAGTRLLTEVNPGPTGSGPYPGIRIGNEYVFSADDDEFGRELFWTCADRFFMDTDGDGYGDPARPTMACGAPSGYVIDDNDCNDSAGGIHPGATEVCDTADNDCDGEIDDPTFPGLTSAALLGGGICAVRIDWDSTTACDGTPVYNVYRSTTSGFDPGPANLLAACVPQDFWIDTSVESGNTYYYVVRAENPSTGGNGPCYGGAEDNNAAQSPVITTSCSAAPQEVLYFSASARDLEVKLEWVNPSSSYGLTRTCWKTGSYPSGPTDGVCVDLVGTGGTYGTTSHDNGNIGGISNGTLYYYAAFVNSNPGGTGDWSAGRFITARPFDTSVAGKWAYSTSATALSSPGVLPGNASFSASNDRILHSSVAGPAGGEWPASWIPASMNGPAQGRPIVLPFGTPTVGGASTVAFVGSHDGRAYAFDADTGVELWASPVLGDGVQGSPSASLVAFGGFHDLILVGTRSPGGDSKLHGLHLADGSIAWTFDNGGGSNGIGIISSQAWVDGANTRAYFTSRRKTGGSSDTIWCVDFTPTSATRLWSRDLGDIDSAPTVRSGAVYIGTNAGTVHALDPATGADLWSAPHVTGDGAVKGYVWFDEAGGGRRLYFSTQSLVHALAETAGSSTTLWPPVSLASPSPVIVIDDDLYVGSSVANGSLVRLDKVTGNQLGSVTLGDPAVAKKVGSPSYDWVAGQVIVGTEQGVVYAVDDGF